MRLLAATSLVWHLLGAAGIFVTAVLVIVAVVALALFLWPRDDEVKS